MAIDPKTTAILLIEYQNDFISEGGVLHGAVEEVMDRPTCWPTPSGWLTLPGPLA
jgi:nicotinamidase-related amidase